MPGSRSPGAASAAAAPCSLGVDGGGVDAHALLAPRQHRGARLGVVGRARQQAADLRVEAAGLFGRVGVGVGVDGWQGRQVLACGRRQQGDTRGRSVLPFRHSASQTAASQPGGCPGASHQHRAYEVGALRVGAGALQAENKAARRQLCGRAGVGAHEGGRTRARDGGRGGTWQPHAHTHGSRRWCKLPRSARDARLLPPLCPPPAHASPDSSCPRMPSSMFIVAGDRKLWAQ